MAGAIVSGLTGNLFAFCRLTDLLQVVDEFVVNIEHVLSVL